LAAATVEFATAQLSIVLGQFPSLCVAHCSDKSDGRVALVLIELSSYVGCRDLRDVSDRLDCLFADDSTAEGDVFVAFRS
jgi:hypothetical protein